MWENYNPRQYDLAMMRQEEIARKAEMARLLGSDREPRAAGVLRHLARAAKDALAPRNVRMPRMRVADGDVLA
jgi:hypothetical protein